MKVIFLSILACAAIGCANLGTTSHALKDTVRGPGAVFTTVNEAAADGLAWSYLQARHEAARLGESKSRVRGGTIHPVAGGYSYREVHVAPERRPSRVQFVLKPDDVAHFRHYPGLGDFRVDFANERLSDVDREIVDSLDPLKRPAYVLTPNRNVRIYTGDDTESHVATLRDIAMGRGTMAAR